MPMFLPREANDRGLKVLIPKVLPADDKPRLTLKAMYLAQSDVRIEDETEEDDVFVVPMHVYNACEMERYGKPVAANDNYPFWLRPCN
jgi:hypothetical protein